MAIYHTIKQVEILLNKIKHNNRSLTQKEKSELLERWVSSRDSNNKRIIDCMDPDLSDFVIGVEYSAICDDRSCSFCKSHNGESLKIDDPRIKENTPPIHLGCRCIWVPINKFEIEEKKINFTWSNIEKPNFDLITF